jgi:hypothetical protein
MYKVGMNQEHFVKVKEGNSANNIKILFVPDAFTLKEGLERNGFPE